MLNKYIKELVETNNRVIVPEFGAFMVQDTAEGKQISFNDFLKFNDGLLANQIIKAERIGKTEATEQIKSYIKLIEESFSAGKPYFVEPIGYLSKDSHGNIKFEMAAKGASTEAQPAVEKTKAAEPVVPVKTAEPVKAEEPVKPVEAVKPTPAPEIKPPVTASEPVIPKSEPVSKPTISKPTQTKTQTSKPMATSSKSGSNTNAIIVLASLVIIIGGIIWAAFAFGWFGLGKDAKQEEIVINVAPAVDSAAMVVDTMPEEPKVVEEVIDAQASKKYFIIAGSFKVPANAERFNKKLIGEGYPSQIVVRNNGFHTVSYNQYDTWQEALNKWREMRETNAETWILVKK